MKSIQELSGAVVSKMRKKSYMALILGFVMQLVFWGSFALNEGESTEMFRFMTNLQYTVMMSIVGLIILLRGIHLRWEARSIADRFQSAAPNLSDSIKSSIHQSIRLSALIDSITVGLLVFFIGYVRLFTASGFIPDWRGLPLLGIAILAVLLVSKVTWHVEQHEYSEFLERT